MNPFTRDPELGPNHSRVLAALVLLAVVITAAVLIPVVYIGTQVFG